MSIFKFRKKEEKEARKMSDVYGDMFAECDGLINATFKATGSGIEDLVSDLNEESGAVLGAAMASLKKMTELAAEQAAIIDRMEQKLDSCNFALEDQNRKLISILQQIN